jgi:hypothetical protein
VPLGGKGDLIVARPTVLERPERFQYRARVASMTERRHRQRLSHGAAAMGARPVDARHQLRGAPVRIHAEDLEDRRRAPNLAANSVVVRDAVRRAKARNRRSGQLGP